MADTYTTNLNLTKPEPGAAEDTWGISLNADLDALDAIFSTSGTQINLNPNQINFADNKKAIFGTGSDLQIFHDGSHSYISENGTGNLILKGGGQILLKSPADENMIVANGNGAVNLFYDNAVKFATTSSGIDVTGRATADGLTSEGTSGTWEIQDNGYIQTFSRAGANYIRASDTAGILRFDTGGTTIRQKIASNGDISFYDDTGSTQGLFWDASAEKLGIGDTTPDAKLTVQGDVLARDEFRGEVVSYSSNQDAPYLIASTSGYTGATTNWNTYGFQHRFKTTATGAPRVTIDTYLGEAFAVTNNNRVGIGTGEPARTTVINSSGTTTLQITNDTTGVTTTDGLQIKHYTSGATQIWNYENSYMAFGTNNTERARIDSSGRLGIGTTSPDALLHLSANTGATLRLESTDTAIAANEVMGAIEWEGNDATTGSSGIAGKIDVIAEDATPEYSMRFFTQDNLSGTYELAERMRIKSDGKVGIGTTSPTETLHVMSGVSNDTVAIITGSQSDRGLTISTYASDGRTDGGVDFDAYKSFKFTTDGTERVRIDSSGNFLVGKTAEGTATDGIELNRQDVIVATRNGDAPLILNRRTSDGDIALFRKDNATVGSIGASSGDVYIGTGDTGLKFNDSLNNIYAWNTSTNTVRDGFTDLGATTARFKDLHLSGTAYTGGYIRGSSSDANKLILKASSSTTELHAAGGTGLVFKGNGDNERARFDSSGNLLVGTTNTFPPSDTGNEGVAVKPDNIAISRNASTPLFLDRMTSDGTIIDLRKDNTTVGSIGTTAGDLLIGTGEVNIRFDDGSDSIVPRTSSGSGRHNAINLGLNTVRFKDLYLAGTAYTSKVAVNTTSPDSTVDLHVSGGTDNVPLGVESTDTNVFIALKDSTTTGTFGAAAVAIGAKGDNLLLRAGTSEGARIDSSGNLLVGRTTSNTGVAGARFSANGFANVTRDGGECINFNRLTSDGTIIDIRKDSTTQGNIGTTGVANGVEIYIASGNSSSVGAGLSFANVTISNYIAPCRGDGSYADNLIDLGTSSARFDDIYATNGTIQTSDRNEKQDIQALTDAEQRVATACKGLIRRFRWQDAVEEKGDDARLHFGVIAQDLQDAFTAEGLDAGDYGMFISSTWEDDDGNEQTRLGVRYNELLAFIITTL